MASDADHGSTRRVQHPKGWVQVVDLPAIKLVALDGPFRGRNWVLALPTIRIGSAAENDIVLKEDTVSRLHGRITRTPGGLHFEDCGSTNGSFVNDLRCMECFLEVGSRLRIGATTFRIDQVREEYRALPTSRAAFGALVGRSAAMQDLYSLIEAVAGAPATVLVQGETGTGKELVARTLHELSQRKGALVTFDCAATSPELVRSELFGHVRGAFTGAEGTRQGAFRSADNGTLFIDEIGELPLDIQPVFLRVLDYREVKPVGGDAGFPVNVRVVAATHRDLAGMAEEGAFREDLYHRFRVIQLKVPPLRERPEDIPDLIEHFKGQLGLVCEFSPEAMECMKSHSWPGNVRALRNTLERVGWTRRNQVVRPEDLELPDGSVSQPAGVLSDVEQETILATFERLGRNQVQTAKALGIGLTTLKRKLKQYRDAGRKG